MDPERSGTPEQETESKAIKFGKVGDSEKSESSKKN